MSAPSFTSFPPSFTSFPDFAAGPSKPTSVSGTKQGEDSKPKRERKREDKRGSEADSDHRKRKRKSEKHRDREHGRDDRRHSVSPNRRERYGGGDDERRKAEEDRRLRAEDPDPSSAREGPLYFTDRRGDALNVRYGSLHTGDVPKYRMVGWGRNILGLDPSCAVTHRGRDGIEVAFKHGRKKMPALTDSKSKHILAAPPTRRLLHSSEDKYKYREIDGFLRLRSNKTHKETPTYREIAPGKHDSDSDESDSSVEAPAESSDSDSETTNLTALQETLKGLEQRLSDHPSDVRSWLLLLSHTLSNVPITTKNAAKARSEITLSVLSRALSAHQDNARSRSLRLRYLQAGEEIWPGPKLHAEWEDALKVNDVELWISWLDWSIRMGSRGIPGVVEDARRVLDALPPQEEVAQLRVLWRVAVALRDAGYIERANAIFQAQAELLFSVPQELADDDFVTQLADLEAFWDSEVYRAGERRASGWASWVAGGRPTQTEPTRSRREVPSNTLASDPYSRWAASEIAGDHSHPFSSRSTDDDDDGSDPYATVLFSDIRPLLLPLHSQHSKLVFRLIWLTFLGLHIPGFVASLSNNAEGNADDRWASTGLVSPAIFPADAGDTSKRITADAHAGVLVGREREDRSGFGPVKEWGYETIGLFDAFGASKWMMWNAGDVAGVDADIVREVFRICGRGDEEDWALLNLAFEAAVNVKSALKFSKSLLASATSSLSHWAAHAKMEALRGRVDDARKVYHTVLNSAKPNAPGASILWWDWAQMEWTSRDDDAALQVIIRSCGTSGTGGVAILRAKRHLEALWHDPHSQSRRDRVASARLSALLELLTSSAQSALAIFDSRNATLAPGTTMHESLTVASLVLLYDHALVLRNPMPPAMLRERAERAVEMYPSNTVILGIFLEAERGQAIWGRVRATMGETKADGTGMAKDVARRVAEVWATGWQTGRWEAEVERTRASLSAAVKNDRTRGSPVLWKLFVEFEVRAGQLKRAKDVLFRAIGECSLSKDLYLLAFGPLRGVFEVRELNVLAETMVERGLRMRVGLDEVVGDLGRVDGAAEEDREDEDEIEYGARELRRLMPY